MSLPKPTVQTLACSYDNILPPFRGFGGDLVPPSLKYPFNSQKDPLSEWLLPYIYQPCSRSRRVVDTFEQLLGGEELYHYHSKLMMKEVRICNTMMLHHHADISVCGTKTLSICLDNCDRFENMMMTIRR